MLTTQGINAAVNEAEKHHLISRLEMITARNEEEWKFFVLRELIDSKDASGFLETITRQSPETDDEKIQWLEKRAVKKPHDTRQYNANEIFSIFEENRW